MFTWSLAGFWAAIKGVLFSTWGFALSFLTSLSTNIQFYFWMGLVIIGLIIGYQGGKWMYKTDCKSEKNSSFNVGYDEGYNVGFDQAKAGKRKLMFPHYWRTTIKSGLSTGVDTELALKAFLEHFDNCSECQKISPEGYPAQLCPDGQSLYDQIESHE